MVKGHVLFHRIFNLRKYFSELFKNCAKKIQSFGDRILSNKTKIFTKKSIETDMKPLKSIQQALTWLCVLPFDKSTARREKVASLLFVLATMCINLCALAASMAFVFKYKSTDLTECLFALIQISGFVNATYTIIVGFFIRRRIPGIFKKLTDIYDASMLH